jgi:hypothetical protein
VHCGIVYSQGTPDIDEEVNEMFKLIFKNTNEELIFDTRAEAEMCMKLSVMVNNDRGNGKRDSKRNYEIVEL